MLKKNIIIFTHAGDYCRGGGTLVQYQLGKVLSDFGLNVRICPWNGYRQSTNIFSMFYENDFPIDDNTVVIYCEGTRGNPLNAKNVVRWMLSELGKNVPYNDVHTWGKNELVYYFNSENKFDAYPEKKDIIYKQLSIVYINPSIKQTYFGPRAGICYAIRKINWHKNPVKFYEFNEPMFEIPDKFEHSEVVEHFNRHKIFISYDPCTFLTMMAAMCGCISVVYPRDNLTKLDWINSGAAAKYIKAKGLDNLYGIAYGMEDIQYAIDTIHLVKEQWEDIQNFNIQSTVIPFIYDIHNFENMQNTLHNNFF
jgi:hypothetical protein